MPSFHTSKSTLKLNGCLFGLISVVSVAPDSPHHASEFGVTPWQLPLSGGVPSEPADDTDLRDSIVTDSDDGNDANHPVLLAPRSVLEGHPMIFAVVPSAFHNELNFYPSSLHDHLSRGMKEGTSYSVHNTNLARDAIRSFRTRVFGSGAPIGFSPDTNSNPESKEERHYPYPLLYSVSQTVKGGSFWGHPDLKRGKDKNKDYIRGTNMDRRLFFDSERDVEMLEDFTSETRWRLPDSVTRDLSAAICRSSRRTGKGGYDKAECSQALSRIKVREIPRGNHGAPVVTSVDELRESANLEAQQTIYS